MRFGHLITRDLTFSTLLVSLLNILVRGKRYQPFIPISLKCLMSSTTIYSPSNFLCSASFPHQLPHCLHTTLLTDPAQFLFMFSQPIPCSSCSIGVPPLISIFYLWPRLSLICPCLLYVDNIKSFASISSSLYSAVLQSSLDTLVKKLTLNYVFIILSLPFWWITPVAAPF